MHALIEYILMSKLIAALNCYARAGQSMYIYIGPPLYYLYTRAW